MNDESRDRLTTFIAHVAMLNQAITKDASREQITVRLAQIDADATALVETLEKDDRAVANAVKEAWQQPAKLIAGHAARVKRQ